VCGWIRRIRYVTSANARRGSLGLQTQGTSNVLRDASAPSRDVFLKTRVMVVVRCGDFAFWFELEL